MCKRGMIHRLLEVIFSIGDERICGEDYAGPEILNWELQKQ